MLVNLILKRDLANFLIMFLTLSYSLWNKSSTKYSTSRQRRWRFLNQQLVFLFFFFFHFVRSIEYWILFGGTVFASFFTFHWHLHLIYYTYFSAYFNNILLQYFFWLSFTFNIHFSLELNVWYPFIYSWCAESSSVNLPLLF